MKHAKQLVEDISSQSIASDDTIFLYVTCEFCVFSVDENASVC